MQCDACGQELPCVCRRQSLMGFLTDFRSTAEPGGSAPASVGAKPLSAPAGPTWAPARPRPEPPAPAAFGWAPPDPAGQVPPPMAGPPPAQSLPRTPTVPALVPWPMADQPRSDAWPGPRQTTPASAGYWARPGFEPVVPLANGYLGDLQATAPTTLDAGLSRGYWAVPSGGFAPQPDDIGLVAARRPPSRRVAIPVVFVVAVAVLVLMAGTVALVGRSSKPSLTSMVPAKILSLTLKAARTSGSVHVAGKSSQDGSTDISSIDMSAAGGTESDSSHGHTASLAAVDGTLYFQADAGYLTQDLGVPVAYASQLADEWLAIPADADLDLQQADDQLHTPVLIDNLLSLSDPIAKASAPAPGEVAITGKVPSNVYTNDAGAGDLATVIVSTKAPYLPISISYSDQDNGSTTLTFTNWGEYVSLTAPANAVPLPAGALGKASGQSSVN